MLPARGNEQDRRGGDTAPYHSNSIVGATVLLRRRQNVFEDVGHRLRSQPNLQSIGHH
jgi:hypothetical protein